MNTIRPSCPASHVLQLSETVWTWPRLALAFSRPDILHGRVRASLRPPASSVCGSPPGTAAARPRCPPSSPWARRRSLASTPCLEPVAARRAPLRDSYCCSSSSPGAAASTSRCSAPMSRPPRSSPASSWSERAAPELLRALRHRQRRWSVWPSNALSSKIDDDRNTKAGFCTHTRNKGRPFTGAAFVADLTKYCRAGCGGRI